MLMSLLAAPAMFTESRATANPMPAQRIALQGLCLMLVLLPASLLLLGSDPRQLNGVSVWVKPIKFELSLALNFATLAWAVTLLGPAQRDGRHLSRGFLIALLAGMFEIGYIVLQAARGRASHFNDGTPIESALYTAMGVGAVLLVAVAFDLGRRILKSPRPGLGTGLRLGAGLGLTLGAAATFVTAGILGSGAIPEMLGYPAGHWIGCDLSDASGLPLVGWSTTGGDLRVPHFFATHAMQMLPLAGWIADRRWPQQARAIVYGTGLLLALLIVGTFLQAAAGAPLIPAL